MCAPGLCDAGRRSAQCGQPARALARRAAQPDPQAARPPRTSTPRPRMKSAYPQTCPCPTPIPTLLSSARPLMKSAHSQSSERRRGRTSLGMRLPVSGSTTVDFDIFGLLCGRAAPAQLSSHASAAQPTRAPQTVRAMLTHAWLECAWHCNKPAAVIWHARASFDTATCHASGSIQSAAARARTATLLAMQQAHAEEAEPCNPLEVGGARLRARAISSSHSSADRKFLNTVARGFQLSSTISPAQCACSMQTGVGHAQG